MHAVRDFQRKALRLGQSVHDYPNRGVYLLSPWQCHYKTSWERCPISTSAHPMTAPPSQVIDVLSSPSAKSGKIPHPLLLAFPYPVPKMNPQALIHLGRLGVKTQPVLGSSSKISSSYFLIIRYSPSFSCLARNFRFDHEVWRFPFMENQYLFSIICSYNSCFP